MRRALFWILFPLAISQALRVRFPQATILLAGIPPQGGFPLLPFPLRSLFGLRGKTFDGLARHEVAGRESMLFLPLDFDPHPDKFSADGFHPSRASYAEFGEALSDACAAQLIAAG